MLKKVLVDYCVYYSRTIEGLSSVFWEKCSGQQPDQNFLQPCEIAAALTQIDVQLVDSQQRLTHAALIKAPRVSIFIA